MNTDEINKEIKTVDSNKISDGYHTFEELYDHRITLWIVIVNSQAGIAPYLSWKSKKHSDGSVWDGWFIAGIGMDKGEQMTYHLPIDRWDEVKTDELEKAPEWDGHTPEQVLERIKSYLY